MNKKLVTIAILIVMISTGLMAGNRGSNFGGEMENILESVEIASLSEAEEEGLLLMREEEKLARDVYLTLYDKWGIRTFTNIAGAESTHMDAMGILMDRYNLDDPIKSDTMGVFTNPDMQSLYNTLVAQGSESFNAALIVGATIEDLDIYDLERLIMDTDNDDIKIVYQNLLKGSRNHIRAFEMQLSRNGVDYQAQYMSDEDLAIILNSDMERGAVISNPNFKF
ncbi:MAG: DUF2202 domain-containing protein [Spirochaetia bacterium]|jgi:hypothetical protein|nr:DUF2202 domain-containing protein [Spirochaetia bacterium]